MKDAPDLFCANEGETRTGPRRIGTDVFCCRVNKNEHNFGAIRLAVPYDGSEIVMGKVGMIESDNFLPEMFEFRHGPFLLRCCVA